MLDYARGQVEIEINSGIDNPIFLLEERVCLTGGNFHAQPIAAVLDFLGIVFTFAGGLSERHTNRLMNPVLSNLPDFLVEGKGVNCGLMVAQYTAAALVSENKLLSSPASADSLDGSYLPSWASELALARVSRASWAACLLAGLPCHVRRTEFWSARA